MKPNLLFKASGFRFTPLKYAEDAVKDLNLPAVYTAMARGDEFIRSVAERVVQCPLSDPEEIAYRQGITAECLKNSYFIQKMYDISTDSLRETGDFRAMTAPVYEKVISSAGRLRNAVGLLEIVLGKLRLVANLTQENAEFTSDGLYGFCMRVNEHLNNGFFGQAFALTARLRKAEEGAGVLIGANIGSGLKGTRYRVRGFACKPGLAVGKNYAKIPAKNYLVVSASKEAEEAAYQLLLKTAGHFISAVQAFLNELRFEAAFYIGCVNLYKTMRVLDVKSCIPEMRPAEDGALSFASLCDLSLALRDNAAPVTNDGALDGKSLVFITGANQGGKSTFLRSVGLAYMMAHCGMQVAAERCEMSAVSGIYTHFSREEDSGMEHGKLDEELLRMDKIVGDVAPFGLILMNEALATTTEHDGALIGDGLLTALYEFGARVFFVTHLYELADGFWEKHLPGAEFLRAERLDGGGRSFRIVPGSPKETSFGEDLFDKIIGSGSGE